jgi:uncharacterized protein
MTERLERPERPPRLPRRRRARVILASTLLIFLLSISGVVAFYTDLLWYGEVKLKDVLWSIVTWKILLAVAFGLGFFVMAAVNLFIVGRIMPPYRLTDPNDQFERYREAFLPYVRWLAIGGSAVLALFFAVGVTTYWDRFALATNMVPFHQIDPVFQKDIGFYVFRLPLLQFVYSWLFSAMMVITLVVAGAHYMTGGIRPQAPGGGVLPQVKAHLSVLIGFIALLKAWGYRLDQYGLLYSNRGSVHGASYTDVNARLLALKLLVVISVIGAILFLVNIRIRGMQLPAIGLGLWLLTSLLAANAYPFIIQRFTVQPAEFTKEKPFIERTIQATRAAYGLKGISVREYPAKPTLTAEDVAANPDTIANIRLWDSTTLKEGFDQLQAIRTYYKFEDVDVDRYQLGGKTRQVMLATRELDPQELDKESWQNQHLVYTHGYGAVASLTAEKAGEGQPKFALKDIPPKPESPELSISTGGVYFGEGSSVDYSVVKTKQLELDYPTEGGNNYKSYEGRGGVPISGPLRRAAFAWRFRNVNLAISSLIRDDSRILFYREVDDRIRKAAPFLRFDDDPYAVIVDQRIKWVIDGFTVSEMYPYSERIDFASRSGATQNGSLNGENNYVRNSVKAVVDAYDGTIDFYVWDETDPIIKAWAGIFPKLLKPKADMPANIQAHVRYPEDLFRIQTSMYTRYHVENAQDFFAKTDTWVIPADPVRRAPATTGSPNEIEPYYVLMQLPGEHRLEYVLILPMNVRARPNMVAWVAARSDADVFGQLIDFRFPKTRAVEGVSQVHARINQTESISRERSLLGARGLGSEVLFGNLLVVPIQDSLLYVQPMFLRAEQNAIPELKNVILATSERVVMGPTLDDALKQLVAGGDTSTPGTGGTTEGGVAPTVAQLLEEARTHLAAADAALKAGDWQTYGREEQAARDAIRKATEVVPAPSPSPAPAASPAA